jgi:hypothetical protein
VTTAELRAVPWAPVLGGISIGVAALAVDLWLAPGGPGTALMWFALAGFAAAAAFVLDEPAAAAVDAVPVPRRSRTARRLLVGLLPLAGWLAGAAAAGRAEPALSWPALAVTGSGVIVVTLGMATGLRRAGHDAPGELVAAGVGATVMLALLFAVPKVGPALEAYDAWSRTTVLWIALTAAAAAVTTWGAADPLTRWGRDRHAR